MGARHPSLGSLFLHDIRLSLPFPCLIALPNSLPRCHPPVPNLLIGLPFHLQIPLVFSALFIPLPRPTRCIINQPSRLCFPNHFSAVRKIMGLPPRPPNYSFSFVINAPALPLRSPCQAWNQPALPTSTSLPFLQPLSMLSQNYRHMFLRQRNRNT